MKLIGKFDIREFDYLTQSYLPYQKEDMNICDRCNRRHCKVYIVRDEENDKDYYCGRQCAIHLLHHNIGKREEKTAEKQALVMKHVKKVKAQLASLEIPQGSNVSSAPVKYYTYQGQRHWQQSVQYGVSGCTTRYTVVDGTAEKTPEKLQANFASIYRQHKKHEFVDALCVTPQMYAEVYALVG